MKALIALLLLVGSPLSFAARVVSSVEANGWATHCAWYVDGGERVMAEAELDADGMPYCGLDVSGISAGEHTIKVAFISEDAIWGTLEGPISDPFSFERPAGPSKPTTLTIVP